MTTSWKAASSVGIFAYLLPNDAGVRSITNAETLHGLMGNGITEAGGDGISIGAPDGATIVDLGADYTAFDLAIEDALMLFNTPSSI